MYLSYYIMQVLVAMVLFIEKKKGNNTEVLRVGIASGVFILMYLHANTAF